MKIIVVQSKTQHDTYGFNGDDEEEAEKGKEEEEKEEEEEEVDGGVEQEMAETDYHYERYFYMYCVLHKKEN